MVLRYLLFALLIFHRTVSFAAINDDCRKLTGLWLGSYTYKHHDDCHRTGACTHLATAEISFQSDHLYQVDLKPLTIGGIFTISCTNNQLKLPNGSNAYLSCNQQGICKITYDNERLSGSIANIGN